MLMGGLLRTDLASSSPPLGLPHHPGGDGTRNQVPGKADTAEIY